MTKRLVLGEDRRVAEWVAPRVKFLGDITDLPAMGVESDGVLVGGVMYDGYVPGARISMHVAGEGQNWLTRSLLLAMFAYPFRYIDAPVIVNTVDSDNAASMRATAHLGFKEMCRIPNAGGGCDLVVFAMQRDECRWLPQVQLKKAA